MAKRYVKAELLAALWRLGGAKDERLPTSHGILDRALKECLEKLPKQLREGLTFGVTGVGLRCYELPDILLAAQEAMLTTEPNPTYLSSIVTINESRARQIAVSYGMSTIEAKSIGERLRTAVHSVRDAVAPRPEQLSVAK
jgi:hypothetical protein